MAFPWTLQKYIFRETGKTFCLTALALTGVLGLGGGLRGMIELGEVTPGQLVRLLMLMLPVAAALTMPVAALFSAAATYGRLSADNEFVACRSSGINMHVLFLPAIVISLAAAIVTFVFSNFVIPGMVRNLETFVHADLGNLMRQRLNRPRGLTFGGRLRVSADENSVDASNPDRILIEGIRFVEVDGEEWGRYGTARQAIVEFHDDDGHPSVSGLLRDLSIYDRNPPGFYEQAELLIPKQRVPFSLSSELKFLTLGELLHFWRYPGEWREVREKMDKLRLAVGRKVIVSDLWEQWRDTGSLVLEDGVSRITMRAELGAILPGLAGIDFEKVTIEDRREEWVRHAEAARATIEVKSEGNLESGGLQIEAYDVRISDGSDWVQKPKQAFDMVAISRSVVEQILNTPDEVLLALPPTTGAPDALAKRRTAAREARRDAVHKIAGTVHERMAFSLSVVVLVILGAALAIVFRGSHVMVAFGISFVPSLMIIIAIVMGKQMSYNAPTHVLGLMLIWGAIAIVVGLDYWILTRVLRR